MTARPLVVMTPKGLLRLRNAGSTLDGALDRVVPAGDRRPRGRPRRSTAARALLRQGLLRHRRARGASGAHGVAVARVEQLYPFPVEAVAALVASYPHLESIVWAQEEPQNMGAVALDPSPARRGGPVGVVDPGGDLRRPAVAREPERGLPDRSPASSRTESFARRSSAGDDAGCATEQLRPEPLRLRATPTARRAPTWAPPRGERTPRRLRRLRCHRRTVCSRRLEQEPALARRQPQPRLVENEGGGHRARRQARHEHILAHGVTVCASCTGPPGASGRSAPITCLRGHDAWKLRLRHRMRSLVPIMSILSLAGKSFRVRLFRGCTERPRRWRTYAC